jgi:enoyl-CoA hydratase/carnithine racemase
MTAAAVRQERRGVVDWVTLDSPSTANALAIATMEALVALVRSSAADDSARGLVLDHTGRVFCAGVDIKERRGLPPGRRDHSELLASLYTELWAYPKPVLCRVAGAVRGGGVGLVVCADAVVATAEASFAFSEVRLGVAPALVGALAVAKLGVGGLAPALLTGQAFGAEAAVASGLATHGAPGDGRDELAALVEGIGLAAPGAVRTTKAILRRSVSVDVPSVIREMTELSATLFDGGEAAEGMAAFAAKRPPSWVPDPAG